MQEPFRDQAGTACAFEQRPLRRQPARAVEKGRVRDGGIGHQTALDDQNVIGRAASIEQRRKQAPVRVFVAVIDGIVHHRHQSVDASGVVRKVFDFEPVGIVKDPAAPDTRLGCMQQRFQVIPGRNAVRRKRTVKPPLVPLKAGEAAVFGTNGLEKGTGVYSLKRAVER